ncbi:hypothetical protein HU200_009175 [Digitaria exilis]|uniref:HTH 3-helical bundle domain-containing protein n=1 Tax=Digitaria exilis TaxID=1010633 RepID=A0A835FL99_9POAL|nr:hypothetical protein HU200_009175 [Digitaria exilis]
MVRSLIARDNATYNNHNVIVNDIQACFPWKEKDQVIELYVELVVEMIQLIHSRNNHMMQGNNSRYWTKGEHRLIFFFTDFSHCRQFLHGLHVYGWGNWTDISEYFVTTKSPTQICSHAQKYINMLESTYEKQHYNTNTVRLHDDEPSVQSNSFGSGQASSSQGHLD